jgi:hypothetical protein
LFNRDRVNTAVNATTPSLGFSITLLSIDGGDVLLATVRVDDAKGAVGE